MKKEKKTNINNKSKKNETVLEVNEITEETILKEKQIQAEKAQKQKEKTNKLRKVRIEKFFKKILKSYDINNIVKLLMWVFFFVAASYVNIIILKQCFNDATLTIFIKEESLENVSQYSIESIKELNVNLDSFDISIRESEIEDIVIKYSRKYDKKIKTSRKDKVLLVEEKIKIFKLFKFNTSNNLMVIEIPKEYIGSLELESKNGVIKLEKYKMVNEEEVKQVEKSNNSFFNI